MLRFIVVIACAVMACGPDLADDLAEAEDERDDLQEERDELRAKLYEEKCDDFNDNTALCFLLYCQGFYGSASQAFCGCWTTGQQDLNTQTCTCIPYDRAAVCASVPDDFILNFEEESLDCGVIADSLAASTQLCG